MKPNSDSDAKALVYDIQRFCLHDGPGMRTTFFFKGCPLRCPWCSNPESIDPKPELYLVRSKCISCGECRRACPYGCIEMGESGAPRIDAGRCVRCFACVDACPTRALVRKGEWYSPEELLEKALADTVFYEESGGGVTVSGGEPLLQARAVAAFLRLAKAAGLHTAMETSGCAESSALDMVLPHCDLVYIDVKHGDAVRHRELVGRDNRLILDNLRRMAAADVNLVVRVPLIPGRTMDEASVDALIGLLVPLRVRVEPILFHQLGKAKYASIGKEYGLAGERSLDDGDIGEIVARMQAAGIDVVTPE